MVEGTPKYMSISCHKGGSPGRRDDLEALGYVLLDLMGFNLPWFNSKSDKDCLTCKLNAKLEEICVDVPSIAKFISIARKTPYNAKPDYKAFKCLLDDLSSSSRKDVVLTKQYPLQQQGRTKLSLKRGSEDTAVLLPMPSSCRRKSKTPLELKSGGTVATKTLIPKRKRSTRGNSEIAHQCVDETANQRSTSSVIIPSRVKRVTSASLSSSPIPLRIPFILVCTGGPCVGITYDVSVKKGGGIIVGSGVEAEIRIVGDNSVSDAHLKLSYADGKPNALLIHRLGDENSFVNMIRLPKTSSRVRRYLKDKDVLTIGNTQLVLRCSKPSK